MVDVDAKQIEKGEASWKGQGTPGIYTLLAAGIILLKLADVGAPADWSWWFVGGLLLIPYLVVAFLAALFGSIAFAASRRK